MNLENSNIEVLRGKVAAPYLFVCEHASRHIPDEFHHLGLDEDARMSHVAWDPGAETMTRHLNETLDCPAVLSKVSRLIYDCNRSPEAKDAVPEKSEIYEIPGNVNLSNKERSYRVDGYYRPFEQAVSTALDGLNSAPALVTIHSFTPVYNGRNRDVELGILHDEDSRLADAMLTVASDHTSLNVQRNEPYGPADGVTHTLKLHGVNRGILNVMLEVRNDLLQTPGQCIAVADMLAGLLDSALARCEPQSLSKRAVG